MSYELLVEFEDQSLSFANGFESGRVYGAMEAKQPAISYPIHRENLDLVSQLAARSGYKLKLLPINDAPEWTLLEATLG